MPNTFHRGDGPTLFLYCPAGSATPTRSNPSKRGCRASTSAMYSWTTEATAGCATQRATSRSTRSPPTRSRWPIHSISRPSASSAIRWARWRPKVAVIAPGACARAGTGHARALRRPAVRRGETCAIRARRRPRRRSPDHHRSQHRRPAARILGRVESGVFGSPFFAAGVRRVLPRVGRYGFRRRDRRHPSGESADRRARSGVRRGTDGPHLPAALSARHRRRAAQCRPLPDERDAARVRRRDGSVPARRDGEPRRQP